MKLTLLTLGLAMTGVALVGLSLVWSAVARSANPWTMEQAEEHAQAGGRMHQLGHELVHLGKKASPAETDAANAAFREAKGRYERADTALQEAQNRGQTTAAVFKWAGIVCVLLGGGGFLLLRQASGGQ